MYRNRPLIFFESFLLAIVVLIPVLSLVGMFFFLDAGFIVALAYSAGFSPILFIWALATIPLHRKVREERYRYWIYVAVGAIPGLLWYLFGQTEVNDTVQVARVSLIFYGALLFALLHYFLKKRGFYKSPHEDTS